LRGFQNRPDGSVCNQTPIRPHNEFPPVIPQRLLSSRARLRFAGYRMLPHYFNRSKSASKPLVQAPSYWHNQRQPRAGFRTLETPDRCLKDRVHFTVQAFNTDNHLTVRRRMLIKFERDCFARSKTPSELGKNCVIGHPVGTDRSGAVHLLR